MSQFHFPRLHFSGNAIIDPATGNNNYHFPLVCYEPNSGSVVLPPRIYIHHLDNSKLIQEINDNGIPIEKDEEDDAFVSISGIDTVDKFKKWMSTPLGNFDDDVSFHWIYEKIYTQKEGNKLKGLQPGYWNYYGTMNFSFEDVRIHSIDIKSRLFKGNDEKSDSFPVEIKQFLGAEVFFLNDLNKRNALMIDVSPAMSIFSQVFSDHLVVQKGQNVLLKGKPYKGALRQISPTRIISKKGVLGSSGTFYSSILFHPEEDSPIREFIAKKFLKNKELTGIGIRYDLYDLEEDQYPDYNILGPNSNPARIKVLGTIFPLLKGELRSANTDRLLVPRQPYFEDKKFGSVPFCVNKESGELSLDVVGAWPMIKAGKMFKDSFDQINIRVKGNSENIPVKKSLVSWDYLFYHGGIIDIPVSFKDYFESSDFRIDVTTNNQEVTILAEMPLRIITDQTGIYSEESQKGEKYLNNDGKRENCILHVLEWGEPKTEPIEVSVMLTRPRRYSKGLSTELLPEIKVSDGSIYYPSEALPGHYFYSFYPFGNHLLSSDFMNYMFNTSCYVNRRIIPAFTEESKEISFELLYEKLLKDYDLIYPSSGIITPFNSKHFSRVYKVLQKIMHEDAWGEYLYMPSSRDMPSGKRKLLFSYLDQAAKRASYSKNSKYK